MRKKNKTTTTMTTNSGREVGQNTGRASGYSQSEKDTPNHCPLFDFLSRNGYFLVRKQQLMRYSCTLIVTDGRPFPVWFYLGTCYRLLDENIDGNLVAFNGWYEEKLIQNEWKTKEQI